MYLKMKTHTQSYNLLGLCISEIWPTTVLYKFSSKDNVSRKINDNIFSFTQLGKKDYIETVNGFFLTKEIVLGNMDKMAE